VWFLPITMIKIGHRGAKGYAPEDTLKSFQKALDLGVDVVELDVQVCKTGELVIIHDKKVDRTTNGSGYVAEKTFHELRNLDAGENEKIPELMEAFDLINRKAKINIEMKSVKTAKLVHELIEEYVKSRSWQYHDFWVSSFNHRELQKFHLLNPDVKIGALISSIPLSLAVFAEELGADSVNISDEFVNKELVDDAHRRGLKVYVHTVNDFDEIERVRQLQVDGIFSDFPDRLE
jgi:glycerophosphoryl diester phosphodiesterase